MIPDSGVLPFRQRSGLSYQVTQLPTPAPASAEKPSRKLAAYLPAILVDAYSEAGTMHDLYPWQVQPTSPAHTLALNHTSQCNVPCPRSGCLKCFPQCVLGLSPHHTCCNACHPMKIFISDNVT